LKFGEYVRTFKATNTIMASLTRPAMPVLPKGHLKEAWTFIELET